MSRNERLSQRIHLRLQMGSQGCAEVSIRTHLWQFETLFDARIHRCLAGCVRMNVMALSEKNNSKMIPETL